jgi:RNA polymerase sigma factor (sigma-70 family)
MSDAPDTADTILLEQFAKSDSEEAFSEIVRRHVGLVHSVALRQTQNAQHAEEITQAVFIILARKAASLGRKTILGSWLYHTARLTAANFQRSEFRRVRREQEVFMESPAHEEQMDSAWRDMGPLLEEAMAKLKTTDRDAVVLRYFENKTLREVGTAMGMEERAAQKRVARGLEKLRAFFTKRGLVLSATIIAGAVSANSVKAASPALAASVKAVALAKGSAATASTLTLVKGALKIMAWTKAKTAIVAGTVVIFSLGMTTWTASRWMHARALPQLDFQVEGTLDFTFSGKTNHENFTASVKDNKWLIHIPFQPGGGIAYEENSFDEDNIYSYTQFREVSEKSINSSGGEVRANDVPVLGHSTDMFTPVWLAYCSAYYLHGITGNTMKSFFFVDRPTQELNQGPYMEVEWTRSKNPPFLPNDMLHPKLNWRYQVLQYTNIDGLSLPSEFLLEYFGFKRSVTNAPIISMRGTLTKISTPSPIQVFRPKSDGRTSVDDWRFADGKPENYLMTNQEWLTTNSPQWQIFSRGHKLKPGETPPPRTRAD